MTEKELKRFMQQSNSFSRWITDANFVTSLWLSVEPSDLEFFAALLGRKFINAHPPSCRLGDDASIWFDLSEICSNLGINPEEITHKPLGFR